MEISDHSSSEVDNRQPRLCGYLKVGMKLGLVKTFKKKWFIFDEKRCKLLFYRNANDSQPLGEIDVAHACFSYDVGNIEQQGLFEIRYVQIALSKLCSHKLKAVCRPIIHLHICT